MAWPRTRGPMDLQSKLEAEDFDISRYIKDVAFRFDSSSELQQHKKQIQGVADQTAQKLKQNVYQNYALFIDTSKEISSLEAEMYQLSHLLHEHEVLTHNLQAISMTEDKGTAQGESAEKHEKHSIASLLETVEGCSSVTEVPGRYLVHSSHLVELDQESYEAVQLVRAFLLNDSLMIGSFIKKRRGPVRYRFQALYEVDNMAIVDVKDTDIIKNSFKILMFPDSHLYQAENPDSKRQWIELLEDTKQKHKAARDALKKEAGTLSAKLEGDRAEKRRPSMPDAEYRQAELLATDSLKDVPESLDVCIAQREFEQAVRLIEETKAELKNFSDSHALRDVRARLNHRINQLSKILMKELEASPSGSLRGGPRAARRAVGLLLRLGRSAKACELFLANHSQLIQRDLEDVKMEGSTSLFIANLSKTFFTGLDNAAQEFLRAFGENNGSYSAFIVWCNNQLRCFTTKSTPVIFGKTTLSTVADCMVATCKESDTLSSIGVDLSFALLQLFHPQICQALNNARRQIIRQCTLRATPETWTPMDFRSDRAQLAALTMEMVNLGIEDFRNLIYQDGYVDLSSTTITFCKCILAFMNEVFRFYFPEILVVFVDCFADLFISIVELYVDALTRDENIPLGESILKDADFVVETVLPIVGKKINIDSGQEIQQLVELHTKLKGMLERHSSRRSTSAEPEAIVDDMEDEDEEEEEEEEREVWTSEGEGEWVGEEEGQGEELDLGDSDLEDLEEKEGAV